MTKQVKYESMTEFNFLELVHKAVYEVLEQAQRKPMEEVPTLTEEQFESISFESSFNEHRIKFYPEEGREVTLRITAEEYNYTEED